LYSCWPILAGSNRIVHFTIVMVGGRQLASMTAGSTQQARM